MSRSTLRDNVGHLWYHRLITKQEISNSIEPSTSTGTVPNIKGLLDYYPTTTLDEKLLVSSDYISYNYKSGCKVFTIFDSFIDFGHYVFKLNPEHRTFYEVVIGDHCQKPHFDIDINDKLWNQHSSFLKYMFGIQDVNNQNFTNENVSSSSSHIDIITFAEIIKDILIEGCITLFKTLWKIDLSLERDLLVYSSHSKEKNEGLILRTMDGTLIEKSKPTVKRSYHLVINNYCHTRNIEAKEFYNKVITWIIDKLKLINTDLDQKRAQDLLHVIIDSSVYSSKQHFRIVGCCKIGTDRYKQFNDNYIYQGLHIQHKYPDLVDLNDQKYLYIIQLEEALISYTKSCIILPDLIPVTKTQHYGGYNEINDELVKKSMNCFVEYYGNMIGVKDLCLDSRKFPFRYIGVNGSLICLRRVKGSHCEICSRHHENENPYLLLVKSDFDDHYLYYHCRRASADKKKYIGTISGNREITSFLNETVNVENDNNISSGFYSDGKLLTTDIPSKSPEDSVLTVPLNGSPMYNSTEDISYTDAESDIPDLYINHRESDSESLVCNQNPKVLDNTVHGQEIEIIIDDQLEIELESDNTISNPINTVNDVISLSSQQLVKHKKETSKKRYGIDRNYRKELVQLIERSL